jgi:hypothetical protein
MIKQPSVVISIVMSTAALATVVYHIAMFRNHASGGRTGDSPISGSS